MSDHDNGSSGKLRIELAPLGAVLEVDRGTLLENVLMTRGMEFPCGGLGTCGGCRVQVLEGNIEPTPEDIATLSPRELSDGWRLACRARADSPLTLKVEQWTMPVLVDDTHLVGARREGLAIAIDLGTTTIVAQLLDLASGKLLGFRTGLNPQTIQGADVMSRVRFAVDSNELTSLIRDFLGSMVHELIGGREEEVVEVVLVGNTVMHHLFCGLDVEPLTHVPFASPRLGEQRFVAPDLGWQLPSSAAIRFLPCIGGFVGSDILAGIVAVGLHTGDRLRALIDLGTNGEISLGNREKILCASTAAGSAFEAGSIKMGMRAATGAISRVFLNQTGMECMVVGDVEPRGICGSGLVDAIAAGLDDELIKVSGRLTGGGKEFPLSGTVKLWQADVRELQLAKAAIASGLRILLDRWGARIEDIEVIYLSGAFGNCVRAESAVRIGLVETPVDRIAPSGNTALRGAKMLLGADDFPVLEIIEHIGLASDPNFQDRFVDCMAFPDAAVVASRTAVEECAVCAG
ncbi:MAG TPA: ASKHA domain-containing protein [Candidatus Angelobacter sp.]|nr:ASKHA domain-containing protein [Candidatus Angelobacter sp.]